MSDKLKEFKEKLLRQTETLDKCLIWKGNKSVWLPERIGSATPRRAMYYAHQGTIPENEILTTCLTPGCVNFKHFKQGRKSASGGKKAGDRLTEAEKAQIKKLANDKKKKLTLNEISKLMNVSVGTVYRYSK